MEILSGGAAVIAGADYSESEGTRRYRVPISRAMGAREIAQTISVYARGRSAARRNPRGEEVLYVVRGSGACYIDGHRYPLESGTGVYVPPGSAYLLENPEEAGLEIVSVRCPEDDGGEAGAEAMMREPLDPRPVRAVRESDQKSVQTGDRTFKVLVNQETGASRVTQFVGVIPPGRAPMHHHTYEEAIYILEGEGRVWTEEGHARFGAGASIYLPRGVSHSLENTGSTDIRLLGVFHPSGSPAVRYDD
ncbi:MAG: cupin domain-containing protein [Blastocatellia bacterium]